jgi:DNA-binding transcriptional MerR regulator
MQTPSGGAGDGTAAEPAASLSVGAVVETLRPEFPGLTVSLVRFLESEGLLEARGADGGRRFGPQDLRRLRRVLRARQEEYLPLRAVRERLDAAPGDDEPPFPGAPVRTDGPDGPRVGREQLLAAAEAAESDLAAWEDHGLLSPSGEDGYRQDDAVIARIVADLGRHGLQPRHLRGVKAAAERQADQVQQVVAPLRRHPDARTRARAESDAAELTELCARLHGAYLRAALRRTPG